MRSRPLSVTVAALLLALLSLTGFPVFWESLFPVEEPPPAFIIYASIILGIVGFVITVGLWLLKRWSFLATLIVVVLNIILGMPAVIDGPTPTIRALVALTIVIAVLILVLVALPTSRRALTAS
jgi:hypothetical protein